jgi:carbon-monoxide dehydrogenase large subunit
MGEGGTIGAPAAVLSAVNDALREARPGAEIDHIPVRPWDIHAALFGREPRAGQEPRAEGSTG